MMINSARDGFVNNQAKAKIRGEILDGMEGSEAVRGKGWLTGCIRQDCCLHSSAFLRS